jgi:hypothetical protein
LNTEIIVVGSEKSEPFQKYWMEENFPFIGLPDPEHIIQKLYGQEVKPLKLGRLPAQVLFDKSGMIRYVHYGNSMVDIPSNNEIINLLPLFLSVSIREKYILAAIATQHDVIKSAGIMNTGFTCHGGTIMEEISECQT